MGVTRELAKAIVVHHAYRHTLPEAYRPCTWDCLTFDVVHRVASFLAFQDLLRFGQVSWRCKLASEDDDLWRRLLLERFGFHPEENPPSWRQLYRFHHELFLAVVLGVANCTMQGVHLRSMPMIPRAYVGAF